MLTRKMQSGFVVLLIGAACTFSSCSKEQTPSPTLSATADKADVRIINGRLVFADAKAFQKVQEGLWQKNGQELNRWEQSLNFRSLRAEHDAVQSLEALETSDLMTEFGFPAQYAALINPAGEYQIGNKIFWFHEGFKYVASSEEELQRIKRDNSLAAEKTPAGILPMSAKKRSLPTTAYLTTRSLSSTNGDGKFPYGPFRLNGDSRSLRKLSFESFLFYEDATYSYPPVSPLTNTIRTGVVMNEYCEYYSFGSGRWYRSNDMRTTSYDLTTNSSASGSEFYPPTTQTPYVSGSLGDPSYSNTHITGSSINHSGGDFQLGLATVLLYSQGQPDPRPITWKYEVTGYYNAYITNDSYPDHTHRESGTLW